MKLCWQKQRNRALTLPEVLAVVAMLIILAAVILPRLAAAKRRSGPVNCVSHLKQIDLSFFIWAGDHNNKYPMAVSVTNGGAMEWIATNNVAACFRVMSNELSTPKILVCTADVKRVPATNFDDDFNATHISYFVGEDVTNEMNPNLLLAGDDNFQISGTTIQSGVLQFPTNAPISWTAARHKHVGNLGFADGSVLEVGDSGLQADIIQTGLATNCLAIP